MVVWAFMHDQCGTILIANVGEAEAWAEHLGKTGTARVNMDVRQVALFRTGSVQQPVAVSDHAEMSARALEFTGVGTVADLMDMQPVPAGEQRRVGDLHSQHHAMGALDQGHFADRTAGITDKTGGKTRHVFDGHLLRCGIRPGGFGLYTWPAGGDSDEGRGGKKDAQHCGTHFISLEMKCITATGRKERRGMSRIRADRLLVEAQIFASRAAARAAIEAGGVRADGSVVTRPSQRVEATARIEAVAAHPYVSRGGLKLAHGLDTFDIEVAARHALDIGASTGGFTDVLLRRGAASVVAVDVGHGQLHPRLRADPRVRCLERMDARALATSDLIAPPDLIVVDASFISLAKLLANPLALSAPGAGLAALFKPQFEVGRQHVGKGGIVRDETATDRAAERFADWLDAQGWQVAGWTDSPIAGGDGNAERLVYAYRR